MSYKVITHNGKAHMDELMGIALLAYYKKELPDDIIRIHPEEAAEIVKAGNMEENCYFIDCGLELSPEKKLFDHHHSGDLGCAALLVFEHYFQTLLHSKLHDYIKLVSLVDTKGPGSLDDFKFKSDSIYYFSFPQKIILKEFETDPLLITKIFVNGLISIIEFEKEKVSALEWINKNNHIEIKKIGNINLLKYNTPPPTEIASGVKSADNDIIEMNDIHVVYSYDKDNNDIRTLFRTNNGNEKVDFTKSKVNLTQFCHKGGFLLKFKPKNDSEWINIIEESTL